MKITSMLTYSDRGGNRRLREYVKVALILLALIAAVILVGLRNRNQMVSQVMATPRPLESALIPTSTMQIVEPVLPVETCPSDPADWILAENVSVPGSNLKGLSPQCAYDQLEKTVAWFYSTYVFGYRRLEAAKLLGFSELPIAYVLDTGRIMVLSDFKDEPQEVNLRFPSDDKGLREWRIDANNLPAVAMSFSGCFRTSEVSGGQVTSWNKDYPVICQYSGDFQTRHLVSSVNDKILTINGTENVRRFMWFGYTPRGNWLFLGVARDWDTDLTKIPDRSAPTLDPAVMSAKYSLSSLPLPHDWESFTGQEYIDAFLQQLNGKE